MSDVLGAVDPEEFGVNLLAWVAGSGLAVLAGLVVLLWPGPIALADRLPFALLLLVPGGFGLYHVYAESHSPV